MIEPRLPLAWLGALGALAGCVYTFDNPVTLQDAGSVTGAIVLDGGASGQVVGTRVDLLWSNLSIDLGPSGRFVFLDLPDGTYTLRYTVPPATAGGAPTVGELLDIYLPFTGASVPDTIALGAISVDLPGTVEGTLTVDGGPAAGAIVGAFVQGGDAGVIEYEGYATAADSTGHYSLLLPHGNHAIWASTASAAASLDIDGLNPGEDRTGQDLALAPPELPGSQLSGYVVVDPDGAHAPSSVVEPILSDPFTVDLQPSCSSCQTRISYGTAVPAQGVSAAQVSVTGLQAGAFYEVTCSLPSTSPPIPAVVLPDIPIVAGQVTLLKQIFMLTQNTLDANGALPPDAGTEDGGGDAGLLIDAGVDAGLDGGSDGGFDAGPDGGTDAGRDAGGADAGSQDAGPLCRPPQDAGPAAWSLVDQAVQDPANGSGTAGLADAVVPLPLPGGGHTLIFSEAPSGLYAVADMAGKFGTPFSFWDGGSGSGEVSGTLKGTSFNEGSINFVVWSRYLPNGENLAMAASQTDGGPWTLLSTDQLSPVASRSQSVAAVFDSMGTPWLAEVTDTSDLELAPLSGQTPQPFTDLGFPDAGLSVEGLVATSCTNPADAGAALCLMSYGYQGSTQIYYAWLTIFDPATGAYDTTQLYTPPSATFPTIGGAGIASVGCRQLELGLLLFSPSEPAYVFANIGPGQMPTFSQPDQFFGANPPALFPWRGSALLINQDVDGGFDDVATFGGWQAPPLPLNAGVGGAATQGYVDSSGAVYVALIEPTAFLSEVASTDVLNLYRLTP